VRRKEIGVLSLGTPLLPMLISYSHKFIYVHVYRVAGTSVRDALFRYAYIPDRQLHLRLLRMMGVHRLVRHHRLEQLDGHATAREIKEKLPPGVFKSFFKFTFVRNPWDWQVSLYHFALQNRSHWQHRLIESLGSFEKYLEWRVNEDMHLQKDFVIDPNGKLLVDFVGKYFSLAQDFRYVCHRTQCNSVLPHLNGSLHGDYRQYYTGRTIKLVAEAFKEDIEYFGYSFDKPLRKEPLLSSGEMIWLNSCADGRLQSHRYLCQ
jgi:hypothetical protein